jgi:hypothetical protein
MLVLANPSFRTSLSEEITDTSSYTYFHSSLLYLAQPECSTRQKTAFIEGLTSSAGMGSESVLQSSRAALHDFLTGLPVYPTSEEPGLSLLETGNIFLSLLKDNLTNDRVLIPVLEVVAFLLDVQILQRLSTTEFKCVCHFRLPLCGRLLTSILKVAQPPFTNPKVALQIYQYSKTDHCL